MLAHGCRPAPLPRSSERTAPARARWSSYLLECTTPTKDRYCSTAFRWPSTISNRLRRGIAVVYQDFAQFALTFGENIAVGSAVPGQVSSRIEEAARWAGADEIAARLPAGYETQLTRRFEGGVELSGGEWQKVGLARGFVRDAGLVILDEPTAALDAEAEYQLFQRFREIVIGKTALLISHRFSTVRMADQILVLDDGRIIEAGGHDELVELGGRYAALYEMQAGRYR